MLEAVDIFEWFHCEAYTAANLWTMDAKLASNSNINYGA